MSIKLIETQKNIRKMNKCAEEIRQALCEYIAKADEINSRKNIYAEEVLKRERQNLRAAYNAKLRKIGEEGCSAVAYLRNNEELGAQKLSLSDTTLTNALSVIEKYGKNMEHGELCDVIDGFRGNLPALRLVEKTLHSIGKDYTARYCTELYQMPNEWQYDEISRSFATVAYGSDPLGSWQDPRTYMKAVNDMSKRLGIDSDSNPYIEQLREMCETAKDDDIRRKALAEGLHITESLPDSTETDKRLGDLVKSTQTATNELAAARKWNEEHMN